MNIEITKIEPDEMAGRETVARYRAQFRAAAYAALSILEKGEVDKVYCDFHDDFVVRKSVKGVYLYRFVQVKTKKKQNHQWCTNDVFGVQKRAKIASSKEAIKESFVGKLLKHHEDFGDSCAELVLMTNVNFSDLVEGVVEDISSGKFENAKTKILIDMFNEAFSRKLSDSEIKGLLRKIVVKANVKYLNQDDHEFEAIARSAIFKYSEVDLTSRENDEIVRDLLALVEEKSSATILWTMSPKEIEEASGIGLEDLLSILSISKEAYEHLVSGGDERAIRTASILQRKLKSAGAPDELVSTCSKWKIEWDAWLRKQRHHISDFDFSGLSVSLADIAEGFSRGAMKYSEMLDRVAMIYAQIGAEQNKFALTREIIAGGVMSAIVKGLS